MHRNDNRVGSDAPLGTEEEIEKLESYLAAIPSALPQAESEATIVNISGQLVMVKEAVSLAFEERSNGPHDADDAHLRLDE